MVKGLGSELGSMQKLDQARPSFIAGKLCSRGAKLDQARPSFVAGKLCSRGA
jgi:hypothetical protein